MVNPQELAIRHLELVKQQQIASPGILSPQDFEHAFTEVTTRLFLEEPSTTQETVKRLLGNICGYIALLVANEHAAQPNIFIFQMVLQPIFADLQRLTPQDLDKLPLSEVVASLLKLPSEVVSEIVQEITAPSPPAKKEEGSV